MARTRYFVKRAGARFVYKGRRFRPVGFNAYNSASDPNIYACGPWMQSPATELDQQFSAMKNRFGAKVVRFWAFQSYTAGGTNYTAMDRVMATARKHSLLVIPVLANWDGTCEVRADSVRLDHAFYTGGWHRPLDADPISYEAHIRAMATRYRNEDAIFAWELANEPENTTAPDEATGAAAMRQWAANASALIKSIDPNHMVSVGVIGTGQRGAASTEDYRRLFEVPTLDFFNFHDYGRNDEPMPGFPLPITATVVVFNQDPGWNWYQNTEQDILYNTWQTYSHTTGGAGDANVLGLDFRGSYSGVILLDNVQIGSRTLDFARGLQGVTAGKGFTIAWDSANQAARITADGDGGEVLLPRDMPVAPGTNVSVRLKGLTGQIKPTKTLAGQMYQAGKVGKPFMVGEAGMEAHQCTPGVDPGCETLDARASKFDRKLDAFYANGGDTFLLWTFVPSDNGGAYWSRHDIAPGDPLESVMLKY